MFAGCLVSCHRGVVGCCVDGFQMRKLKSAISPRSDKKAFKRIVGARRALRHRAHAAFVALNLENEPIATPVVKKKSILAVSRRERERERGRGREMRQIIARVLAWAGGNRLAIDWYRSEPIPAFGGRSAESLGKSGQAEALRDYLDSIAVGGFA